MNYSSSGSKYTNDLVNGGSNGNVWQDIISSDAKFNLYRINNNSQLSRKLFKLIRSGFILDSPRSSILYFAVTFQGTLYMRRRTQLLRENAMKYRDKDTANTRRSYLHLRTQILEQKYGPLDQA